MNLKEELIKTCHKVYANRLVAAYDGNLSARIDAERIFITRSGVNKGEVTADDILVIDNDGNLLEGSGKVTTEVKLHLKIYNNRSDVNSVIHSHPIYSTAISISHNKYPDNIFPEAILTLGRIPICKYATPSTVELPQSLEPYLDFANVFLLENHGAVSVGNNITTAYFRMEKLEHISKTIFIAKSLGNIKTLSNEEIEKLYSIAESTYGILLNKKNKVN